jgi:hypothetical protein
MEGRSPTFLGTTGSGLERMYYLLYSITTIYICARRRKYRTIFQVRGGGTIGVYLPGT